MVKWNQEFKEMRVTAEEREEEIRSLK